MNCGTIELWIPRRREKWTESPPATTSLDSHERFVMDLLKIYNALCERGKQRLVEKVKKGGLYADHHIVPKSLGGSNEPSNIARLTFREHFLAHWLLFRIHHSSAAMMCAFKLMCGKGTKGSSSKRIPSRLYENARKTHAVSFSSVMVNLHSEKDSLGRSVKGVMFSRSVHSAKDSNGKSIHSLNANKKLHSEKLDSGKSAHAVMMGNLGIAALHSEKDEMGRPVKCVMGAAAVHSLKYSDGKSKHAVDATRKVWKCCSCGLVSHAMGIGRHHKSKKECAVSGKVRVDT